MQRVFIFDACRLPLEAEIASRGDAAAGASFEGDAVYRALAFGRKRQGEVAEISPPDAPLAILNSCLDQERAEELPQFEHGLFTATLLEVLQNCDLQ